MTSPDDEAAGSVEVPAIAASNARSADVPRGSVRTAKVTVIDHPSASSKDWQYHHHNNVQ